MSIIYDLGRVTGGFIILGFFDSLTGLQNAISAPDIGDAYAVGTAAPYDIYVRDSSSWVNIGPLQGEKGEKGLGLEIYGHYQSFSQLQSSVTNPAPGDAYSVGGSLPYDIYFWDGVNQLWHNHGSLQGAAGEQGEPGRGIAAGGAAGEVLIKASPADYDTEWEALAPADIGAEEAGAASSAVSSHNSDSEAHGSQFSAKLDKSGGTMTGALVAQSNTDYSTEQARNIIISDADLEAGVSTLANGTLYFVYE